MDSVVCLLVCSAIHFFEPNISDVLLFPVIREGALMWNHWTGGYRLT